MEATGTKKQVNGKKIAKIIVDVFFWIVFAVALVFTVLAFTAQASPVGMPTLGKTSYLTVQSDSMAKDGYFKKGDMIVTTVIKDNEEEISKLQPGDVITFKYPVENDEGQIVTILNTHQIIEIKDIGNGITEFTTHGVNNPEAMVERITNDAVIAKWTGKTIPGLGKVVNYLQPGRPVKEHLGFILFIIVPLAGFLTYEVVYLVLVIKKIKNKDKRTISAAEEELIKQRAVEEFLAKQEAEKTSEKQEK